MRIALLREVGNITVDMSQHELTALIEAHRLYFTNNLPAGKYVGFVADADGRIVATGGLVFLERPPYNRNLTGLEAYVMSIYTVPEWRGIGVATAIMKELLAFARQASVKRVWLHAEPEAKQVYERAGFVCKNSEMEVLLQGPRRY